MLACFLNDTSSWPDRLVKITNDSRLNQLHDMEGRRFEDQGHNSPVAKVTKYGFPAEIDLS